MLEKMKKAYEYWEICMYESEVNMNYPENLKKGDAIGICAPSGGITKDFGIKKLEAAEKQLQEMGYKIIETESVRKEERGRSASGRQRAKEFMELLENDDVKLIIFATGGDFLVEMLEYLDFEKIKTLKPKWMQGFSDITGINYLFNTMLEIPSIYGQTIKDYAMKPLYRNLTDALKIASGEEIEQTSFEKHEEIIDFRITESEEVLENQESIEEFSEEKEELEKQELEKGYDLTQDTKWININNEEKIKFKGRSIGGCLDCIKSFIGTKYDNVNNYIEKYKQDGILWFLEVFEMSTPTLYLTLWQMKQAGYFKYCKGIIFGRPLFIRNDYDIGFNQTVKDVLGDLNIPIICDADIGHVAPQFAMVNGAVLEVSSENGKGKVKTWLK